MNSAMLKTPSVYDGFIFLILTARKCQQIELAWPTTQVNKLIKNGRTKVSEDDIAENLYSYPDTDIDFVIRTSGEMRVSNFMLYQLAYSEFYFPKVCWPAFNKRQLYKSLKVYAKRNRRFGGN